MSQAASPRKFISKFTKGYRFEPPKVEYEVTHEKLSGSSGMGSILDLFCESKFYKMLRLFLPVRQSNNGNDTLQYALCLLVGFWIGADCLEDIERLRKDALLLKKLGGEIATAKAFGDWLRDFNDEMLSGANTYLSQQALSYRNHLNPEAPIILDMDSTSHPQTGQKIEGVGWNYKNEWALDSLSCFCNMGFCYGFELRPGSTFSSQGAPVMLKRIVGEIKKDATWQGKNKSPIYFRADSAFCNEETLRECLLLKIKFTITAHGNLRWEGEARKIADSDWAPWVYTREEIEESIAKQKPLPEVEVASLLFTPSWGENIRFKLIVKRSYEVEEEGLFKGLGYWNYYGVLTNVTDFREEPQSIMEHHMQRGNAENRIKAFKGDYDLKHLPCLKMNANRAYGLMGMIALNFHRALSLVEDPKCPHFAKSFRERLIRIPGRIVQHARALKIKIEEHWLREVMRLRKAWHEPPQIMLTFKLRYNTA